MWVANRADYAFAQQLLKPKAESKEVASKPDATAESPVSAE
jgi:hypothetical protein